MTHEMIFVYPNGEFKFTLTGDHENDIKQLKKATELIKDLKKCKIGYSFFIS